MNKLKSTLTAIVGTNQASDATIASTASQHAHHQAPVNLATIKTPEVTQTDIKCMKLFGFGLSYNPMTGNVAAPTLTNEAENIMISLNKSQQAESVRCTMMAVTEQLKYSEDFLCHQGNLPTYSMEIITFMSQIRMYTEKLNALAEPNVHELSVNAFLSNSISSAREKKSARNTTNVKDALGEVDSKCTKLSTSLSIGTLLK